MIDGTPEIHPLAGDIGNAGRGATRSVNSFPIWSSEFGLMPET